MYGDARDHGRALSCGSMPGAAACYLTGLPRYLNWHTYVIIPFESFHNAIVQDGILWARYAQGLPFQLSPCSLSYGLVPLCRFSRYATAHRVVWPLVTPQVKTTLPHYYTTRRIHPIFPFRLLFHYAKREGGRSSGLDAISRHRLRSDLRQHHRS